MIDIKMSLSIVLPGRTMLSKEECLKTTQKVWKDKNGKTHKKSVIEEDWNKMDSCSMVVKGDEKGAKPERITFHTRKSIPARQNLNICTEAYNQMIDENACPEWSKTFVWKKLSKEQRLKAHMEKIAEALGGELLGYHVFED